MIRNIVLDMGNVLLDYNPRVPLEAFVEKEPDRALIEKELFGGPEWVQRDLGNITIEEMYESVRTRIPVHLHASLRRCAYEWEICMIPIEIAKEFCSYIRKKGYGMYVLSNASDTFYDYFSRFAPPEEFDGILVSSEVHRVKPNKEIYECFLEKFHLKAEECLFIDDRQDNVDGAIQAGMQGAVFQNDFDIIKEKYKL